MSKKTIKIRAKESDLLWEAMRRMLWVGEKKPVDDEFLGLDFPYRYRCGVEAGLFVPSYGKSIPRTMQWYKLTLLGQKVVKQVIRKKIIPLNCHDVLGRVPCKITVML